MEEKIRNYIFNETVQNFFFFHLANQEGFEKVEVAKYIEIYQNKEERKNLFIFFIDPFNQKNAAHSLINNLLYYLGLKLKEKKIEEFHEIKIVLLKDFLCFHKDRCITFQNSLVWNLNLNSKVNQIKIQRNINYFY